MKKEIWKPVVGYEGLYEDSNMGRVKSLERKSWNGRNGFRLVHERILKPIKQKNGYLYVDLCKDGEVKRHLIHRLVATSFISNPHNLPCINHKDCNPSNNRAENLEWCTYQYNTDYSVSKPVHQYTCTGELVREYKSIIEAHRVTGIHRGDINSCALGKHGIKSAGGYLWKSKEAV